MTGSAGAATSWTGSFPSCSGSTGGSRSPRGAPYLQRFAAYYYNRAAQWGKGVAINFKERAFADGTAVYDVERGQLADVRPVRGRPTRRCRRTPGAISASQDYKTAADVVRDLVDIVSKNGVLLLNIGPRADGTIPEQEQKILEDIGAWLAVNGEAIYGSRPWKVFGEGPTQVLAGTFNDTRRSPYTSADFRFTLGEKAFYAVAMEWPVSGRWVIRTLARGNKHAPLAISSVTLLGAGAVKWSRTSEGLVVEVPAVRPPGPAFVLKVT